MAREHSLWGRFFFDGHPSRAEREEKVLLYIIHRVDEDADLREVLREPYVRRNCSRGEIEEILSNPACRERMEKAFRSGELDPGRRRRTLEGS